MKKLLVALVVLAIALVVGAGRDVDPAYAATPLPFASVIGPIGVAAAPGQLLVTGYCGDPRQVQSISSSAIVSLFATLPPRGGGCFEDYIAISPGLGQWAGKANYVYVTQGPDIVEIDPLGNVLGVFATIPSLPPTANGITFDHVGSFGYDMIVTGGSTGEVWRVNSSGTPTLVGTVLVGGVPTTIEGPDVAPLGFAPFGGQVLVAAELADTVYAVDPAGVVSVVASWDGAESVHFIPPSVCSFGTSNGAFFTAIYPTDSIIKFPPGDFAGLGGSALVTGEIGARGIGLLTSTGTGVTVSTFQTDIGQHEGSAFVDCAVPSPSSISICKQTEPEGSGQVFNFDQSHPKLPTVPFFLNDNGCHTIPPGGPYTFTEYGLPPEWQLVGIVCTSDGVITTFTFNPNGANTFTSGDTGVTIHLGPGESVTCTFTNQFVNYIAVGGIGQLLVDDSNPSAAPAASGSGSPEVPYAAVAGGIAAAVLAVAVGGWYARRLWMR